MERLMKNLIVAAALISTSAMANMPVKYNKCPIKVTTPTNSAGHFMSEDCQTLYVLPALKNKIIAENVLTVASNAECRIIKDINENYKDKRKFLERQLNYAGSGAFKQDQQELEDLDTELYKEKQELDEALAIFDFTQNKVANDLRKVNELQQNLNKLNPRSFDYILLEMQLNDAKEELAESSEKKERIEIYVKTVETNVTHLENAISKKGREIESKIKSDEGIYEQIRLSLEVQAKDPVIKQYLEENGATVSVKLTNSTAKLVNMYRIYNPGILNVQAMPVNTKLKFTTNVLAENNLTAIIAGAEFVDQVEGATYNQYKIPFSNSVGAIINVDKFTTCTKGKYRLKSEIDSVVNANVYYDFDLLVNSYYRVTYNMSEVFKKIKAATNKNGIFKSKHSIKLVQDLKKSEAFKIEFYSQDITMEIQEKQKEMIIRSFIDRALKSVGVSYISYQTGSGMELPGQIQGGATQAASKLRNGCENEYCQYASLGLDIGHSLFGGSTQSNSFISSQNFEQEENYNESKVIKHYGSAGFSKW